MSRSGKDFVSSENGEVYTLKNGNKSGKRQKGKPNNRTTFFHLLGPERMESLLELQWVSAQNGNEESQRFLINKGIPTPKPGRFFKTYLHEIKTLEDVSVAQREVMNALSNAEITIEEAEKLFEIIAQQQNTITTLDILTRLLTLEEALKQKSF